MKRAVLLVIVALAIAIPVMAGPPAGIVALDRLQARDVPVVLTFENRNLSEVIRTIGAAAGFEASFADEFTDRKVTVSGREKLSVKELLTKLAREHGLAYEVPSANRLVVKGGGNGGRAT